MKIKKGFVPVIFLVIIVLVIYGYLSYKNFGKRPQENLKNSACQDFDIFSSVIKNNLPHKLAKVSAGNLLFTWKRHIDEPWVSYEGKYARALYTDSTQNVSKTFSGHVVTELYKEGYIIDELQTKLQNERLKKDLQIESSPSDLPETIRLVQIFTKGKNLYVVNLSGIGFGGAHHYWLVDNNKVELITEGQELPDCAVFEKRKIGKGIYCTPHTFPELHIIDPYGNSVVTY